MNFGLKGMLNDLGLNDKWIATNIVDQAFVDTQHALLPSIDAEHLRIKFYAKFFNDRKGSNFSDADVKIYLELVALEIDIVLKSWAVGCLIECGSLSAAQLKSLSQSEMLDPKHKLFLEREIK